MTDIRSINGGVCAPLGFRAGGVSAGVKSNSDDKKDLALIVSDVTCRAAGVFTTNKVKGAAIAVSKEHLKSKNVRAIIANSGNANTCNSDGEKKALMMCEEIAGRLDISKESILIGQTGVIGQKLNIEPIISHMDELISSLSKDGSLEAEKAIMTTDTLPKEEAVEFSLGGKLCHIGGIAKGSGMIHPNMATTLIFLTSDVAISDEMLNKALKEDVPDSFNMVSVDGDTSTNDTCLILANGLSGNPEIIDDGEDFNTFKKALSLVTRALSRKMAGDGEGATKLLECIVSGGQDKNTCKIVAKSVICSSLLKAAMFGSDANWGRVLCAIGYSGADVDISKINVAFGSKAGEITVCENGAGVDFSENDAKKILSEKEIDILINLNLGECKATAWGCDLSYDYVKINGDYRS